MGGGEGDGRDGGGDTGTVRMENKLAQGNANSFGLSTNHASSDHK